MGNRNLNRNCVEKPFGVYILFPYLRGFCIWRVQLKFFFFLTWCICMHLSILSKPSKRGYLKCTIPVSSVQQTTYLFFIKVWDATKEKNGEQCLFRATFIFYIINQHVAFQFWQDISLIKNIHLNSSDL